MLTSSELKKEVSKISLNAISWKAVVLPGPSSVGRGPPGSFPPACLAITACCSGLGFGKPLLPGALKARGTRATTLLRRAVEATRPERSILVKAGERERERERFGY